MLARVPHTRPLAPLSRSQRHQRQPCSRAPGVRPMASAQEAATAAAATAAAATTTSSSSSAATNTAAQKYGWELAERQPDFANDPKVREVPVASIRRPLAGVRGNDQEKVEALMQSIQEVGLHEPIDVLEVEGQLWGFSGCHRYEAHQRLGKETILVRVRKANRQALKFHMM